MRSIRALEPLTSRPEDGPRHSSGPFPIQSSRASRKRPRRRLVLWIFSGLAAACAAGVVYMFFFWPFSYAKVQPLLQDEFHSSVEVSGYYRTYWPHPGFVASGITFRRWGHEHEPPLATVGRLQVVGTWTALILQPHTLYQIWLRDVHVQIASQSMGQGAADSTEAHPASPQGPSHGASQKKPSQQKMRIETIVADGTTLDLLRDGKAYLHLSFPVLQIHNLRAGAPLTFVTRANVPWLGGVLDANGTLGPLEPSQYATMPLQGTYSLQGGDLRRLGALQGHTDASGTYRGRLNAVALDGRLAIPNFRAGQGHVERLDASFRATLNGTTGDLEIHNARLETAGSTIQAEGSLSGRPRIARVSLSTTDADLERLLDLLESRTPSVQGKVAFQAHAEWKSGPETFLKRLQLQGQIALDQVTFVRQAEQQKMDALSARVRKANSGDDVQVHAAASGATIFQGGVARFRGVLVTLPGATARLHGTFNLLDTRVHMTGNLSLQQGLFHDLKGWKRWLAAPLDPLFRRGNAGAVVPIAVTGTADHIKIGQNLLHTK